MPVPEATWWSSEWYARHDWAPQPAAASAGTAPSELWNVYRKISVDPPPSSREEVALVAIAEWFCTLSRRCHARQSFPDHQQMQNLLASAVFFLEDGEKIRTAEAIGLAKRVTNNGLRRKLDKEVGHVPSCMAFTPS